MDPQKVMAVVTEGVHHLEFAMEFLQWQVLSGRLALFEHPAPSRAWREPSVEKCL